MFSAYGSSKPGGCSPSAKLLRDADFMEALQANSLVAPEGAAGYLRRPWEMSKKIPENCKSQPERASMGPYRLHPCRWPPIAEQSVANINKCTFTFLADYGWQNKRWKSQNTIHFQKLWGPNSQNETPNVLHIFEEITCPRQLRCLRQICFPGI